MVEQRLTDSSSGGRVALAIHKCRKPTIAAMQGSAVGVGMTMVLPAAVRIAHNASKYGFVFGRRGITMESCSSYFLPRLIGFSRAMYLVSTGAVFPPTSPHFNGLFAESLADPAAVLPRALELATEIAQNVSPMASTLNRALMWRGPASPEEAHLLESSIICHMFGAGYVVPFLGGGAVLTVAGTRRRVLRRFSKNASLISRLRWKKTAPRITPGGMRRALSKRRRRRKSRSCSLHTLFSAM